MTQNRGLSLVFPAPENRRTVVCPWFFLPLAKGCGRC